MPGRSSKTSSGRVMLYKIEILAEYTSGQTVERRWITVDKQPEPLADAEFRAYRWKGQQCTVRWTPAHPDQIVAKVN